MKPSRHSKSSLEVMLHRLGAEARQTPFDAAMPLRLESEIRRRIASRSFEPALTTFGGLAAAVLIAIGSWLAPTGDAPSGPKQGTLLTAPTDTPPTETHDVHEDVETSEREP